MAIEFRRKMYVGVGRFLLPVPRWIAALGERQSVAGAKRRAALLSDEERRAHHFIVRSMATATDPIAIETVAQGLGITAARAAGIVDKLEGLKTFVYRNASAGVNWAYPLSLEDTGHRMSADSGERFFAA